MPGLAFPNPTFSLELGLTQEDPKSTNTADPQSHTGVQPMAEEPLPTSADNDSVVEPNRRSKRAKVVPRGLVGEYHCNKRFLTRAWEAFVNATRSPNTDYSVYCGLLKERLLSDL